MMSILSVANKEFRKGNFDKAYILYNDFINKNDEKAENTPSILYKYAIAQVKAIDNKMLDYNNISTNIVITTSNAKYFSSLIMLLESIVTTSYSVVTEILVYNFGLEKWQLNLISNISKVTIFKFDLEIVNDERIAKFNPTDPKTYFFKVYALHYWKYFSIHSNDENIALLWIDSGIVIQKTLSKIFAMINQDDCFFIDHSDVDFYYTDTQNLVVNVLSPSIAKSKKCYRPLRLSQMLRPYIKANFFGLKLEGKYKYLLKDHLDICLDTEVLHDPRNIKSEKEKNYWLDTTDIIQEINRCGIKNTGKYLYGRHEQAVWSYLVARDDIKIHDSIKYNYTVAPGSGWINESNWDKIIRPKVQKQFHYLKDYLNEFVNNSDHTSQEENNSKILLKEKLIQKYMDVGKKVYLSKPLYDNIGFPHPQESSRSTVILHRGSLAKKEQYKYSGKILNQYKNIRDDIFILLGNGPSLGDVDLTSLRQYHTFGLNAAYRAYDRINFWPKYFGCFDALVCNDHSDEFKKLIRNSPIEKFFFINFDDDGIPIFPEKDIQNNKKFQNYNFKYRTDIEKTKSNILATSFDPFVDMRTSGTNSIQTGLLLGYRKFILLGVDQNYVEVVNGAAKNNNYHKLIMKETPKENPNYWFSDYQVKGDKFNRPNLQGCQVPAWNNLSLTLDKLGIKVEIYNCSPITTLKCFKKASLDFALRKLNSLKSSNISPFQSNFK